LASLVTPEKVRKIQTVLYEKAKREPNCRFYSLIDKIYRLDILEHAYRLAKANKGSPGADGVTFERIEREGRDRWLGVLAKEIREGTYTPGPVRRTYIEKANGKLRPLGIPNLKDRVAQTAAGLVLGCIFEADLADGQYAYRSGKKAIEAVKKVQCLMNRDRHLQVVDADLSGYFDSIPHPELMRAVARRVADGKVLRLLKMWLEAPVEEKDRETGYARRTTLNKDNRVGTPQGAPVSPLFSNIYMREFITRWKGGRYDRLFGGCIVNYADDLVICCRNGADIALETMDRLMKGLKLTVNTEKTKVCIMPGDRFVFLGYEFKELMSFKKRIKYIGMEPSGKAVRKLTGEVHAQTAKNFGWMETSEMAKKLNSMTRGWANYFCSGAVSKTYRRVSMHTLGRFRQWLGRKLKWKGKGYKHMDDKQMCGKYGLVNILDLLPRYS
jgi:group II intron reverse transcriptase/maturase